jgi:hypothetical protein
MKTLLLFFKRFFIILSSLTTLVVLAFLVYVLVSQGTESEPHQDYLKNNMERITVDASPAFRIFDRKFYENQVFLLGESHGYHVPQALDFAMLKHLNAQAGVRYYLAEVDYCQAYFLNKYLNTGDESFLNTVFEPWINEAQWGSEEFYAKIKKIYQLNASLPAARRIRFLGVDKIQSVETVKAFLRDFPGRNQLPAYRRQPDRLAASVPAGRSAPKEPLAGWPARCSTTWTAKKLLPADPGRRLRHLPALHPERGLTSIRSNRGMPSCCATWRTSPGNWGWPMRNCTASGATTTPCRPHSGSACPSRPSSKGRTCPSATASCRLTSFRWAAT